MPDPVTAINTKTLIRDASPWHMTPAVMLSALFASPMPAREVSAAAHTIIRAGRTALLALLLISASVCATVARADELADVTRIYKAGQLDEAAKRADAFLSTNPRDPRMRFLKGVMLMDQNRSADAQLVFERLTQDYPELPEPYNNLAVIYAAQGDYPRARVALEMVVRTNPGYALAYENLGDVHLKLASQAYGNAQRLDTSNTSVGAKLRTIRELLGPVASAPQP